MNRKEWQAYHKHISDVYNARSANHENSEWHRATALKLIDDMPPTCGHSVLDVGTGTGTIAFRAASLVGPTGSVVGIDISTGMLTRAKRRLSNSAFTNLSFVLADAERPTFSDASFDRIYCASAFFCMLDPLLTLRRWHALLKPEGILGLHALPETSYFWLREARKIFKRHGYPYLINEATATIERSEMLLSSAGYRMIDIHVEESGFYRSAEDARSSWIQAGDFYPGQYPHPLVNVPPEILAKCKKEYEEEIEALITEKGIWNDISMYYIYARK